MRERATAPLPREPTMPYLGGVDGIRALAVTAVLFYHGDVAWVPGGFLGVEVFFVVSGYLITALLLREHRATGRIRFGQFLARRARRLLPALGLYLVGSYVIALVLARDVLDEFREGILAAVFYVYNWFAIGNDISYAEGFGRKSFLHHLWSLAIEEQFYLIWPLLLWGGLALFGRRIMFVSTLGLIAGSTALMWLLYEPFTDPVRVYYGTDTRAAGLLVGAATAFLWRPWEWRLRSRWMQVAATWLPAAAGFGALIVLGWSMWHYDLALGLAEPLFQGGFLLVSVTTAVLIAGVAAPASPLGAVMAIAPLRWIGTRSYGLYLWHWPVFQVTRPRIDVDLDIWSALILRLVVTAALAEASYRLVERPISDRRFFRRPNVDRWRPRAVVVAAFAGPLMMVGTLLVLQGIHSDQHDGTPASEAIEAAESPVSTATQPAPTAAAAPPPTTAPAGDESEPEQLGLELEEFAPALPDRAETEDPTVPVAPAPIPIESDLSEPPQHVTFIGDSVMEGATSELLALVRAGEVDTMVGRHWFQAPALLGMLDAEGDLGDAVVIHLGNNSPINEELFDEVMAELVDVDLVAVVNLRVPVRWEGSVNDELASGVERWDNAVLVDWHDRSNERPRFFADDGVHIGERGRKAYVRAIARVLGVEPVAEPAAPTPGLGDDEADTAPADGDS